MSSRPKRAPSSGTWARLTAESRAELYASEHADRLLLEMASAEDGIERRMFAMAALREAHRSGSEREADLHTAIDLLREQVARLRREALER